MSADDSPDETPPSSSSPAPGRSEPSPLPFGTAARRKARLLSRKARRSVAVTAVLIVSAVAFAVQTVPELVLFHERFVLDLQTVESEAELQPIDLPTADGLSLRSWYRPPAEGMPVIVYFPGRRGDIVGKPSHLFDLARQGYGLMLAGYRGYGGNPGRPSEERFYEDAAALLAALGERHLAPYGTVLYGYSLGTGVASYLAADGRARGLILEAPFTSFADLVHHMAGPVPGWLVRSRFDTGSRFTDIHVPILLLAGQNDRVTPPAFAKQLASANMEFAALHVFPEASHGTLIENGAFEAIVGFLAGLD